MIVAVDGDLFVTTSVPVSPWIWLWATVAVVASAKMMPKGKTRSGPITRMIFSDEVMDGAARRGSTRERARHTRERARTFAAYASLANEEETAVRSKRDAFALRLADRADVRDTRLSL